MYHRSNTFPFFLSIPVPTHVAQLTPPLPKHDEHLDAFPLPDKFLTA